jgi:hypothetical protein
MRRLFRLVFGDVAIMRFSLRTNVFVIRDTSELTVSVETAPLASLTTSSPENANSPSSVDVMKFNKMVSVSAHQASTESTVPAAHVPSTLPSTTSLKPVDVT